MPYSYFHIIVSVICHKVNVYFSKVNGRIVHKYTSCASFLKNIRFRQFFMDKQSSLLIFYVSLQQKGRP